VYFIGVEAKKRLVGQNMDSNNHGFDDDQALYIHVYHDHVAYRYEVLKVRRRFSLAIFAVLFFRQACDTVSHACRKNKRAKIIMMIGIRECAPKS